MHNKIDKSQKRIRKIFSGVSAKYDRMNRLLSLNRDIAWRKEAAKTVINKKNLKVLDLCSGTGDQAIADASIIESDAHIVCCDLTPEMLHIAVNKCENKLPEHITPIFLTGDAHKLPFPDNCFDRITVAFGIRNLSEISDALREMCRVLKKGGMICILEFTNPKNKIIRWLFHLYLKHVVNKAGDLLTDNKQEAYAYLNDSISQWPAPEELAVIMNKNGFAKIKFKKMNFGSVALHTGEK